MAGARITRTFDDKDTVRRLQRLSSLMVNTTPLMRAIGVKLASNTQDRLGGGHAPDGTAWPGLLPAYALIKRGTGMLVASGMLRRSITFSAGQNNVVVGSNRIYAAVHQFGATIKAKTPAGLFFFLGGAGPNRKGKAGVRVGVHVQSVRIPARPYLGISTIDSRDIIETTNGFILRPLSRS